MSRMLSKMNLISVVQQLPKEDIETIQGYVEMIEEENRQAILNNEEMLGLKEQNEKLKKQLENYKKLGFKHLLDKNNNLETQQKEFIKYLEDMLDDENDIFSVVRVKDVLQKYKEIIGVSDENNIK